MYFRKLTHAPPPPHTHKQMRRLHPNWGCYWQVIEAKNCFDSPFNEPSHDLNPKTEVAAREHKERKARQMNNENEDHKNGGWGNLQIPFSLCPSRSFAAIQFRSSGLITPQFWGNDCPVFGYVRARILLADSWPYRFKSIAMRMKNKIVGNNSNTRHQKL
jgi:hypothetical protein